MARKKIQKTGSTISKRGDRLLRTERIVRRRIKIIKKCWTFPDSKLIRENGRLRKYNLKCTCKMCKKERYDRIEEKRKNDKGLF